MVLDPAQQVGILSHMHIGLRFARFSFISKIASNSATTLIDRVLADTK